MYLERHGTGPRRFLGLHGWSGDHTTFDPLLPHLPPEVGLFTPDLPGCGRSPAPREWRLKAVAEEIAALIRELANPELTVVGNCSGGLLGLCAALQLLDNGAGAAIERMVLIDPLAYWPWYFRVFASDAIGRYAYACAFENPVGRWLVNACLAGRRKAETNLTEGFDVVCSAVTRGYLRILREIEGPEQFAKIDVLIEIVHGEHTFEAVRKSTAVYRRIWPQAEVTEVPEAGHLPLVESPAAVARVLFGRELCEAV